MQINYTHELSRVSGNRVAHLCCALFDACLNLNPHQVDAALFALSSPLSKGVLLVYKVSHGKTIETGLVFCQYWVERWWNILVINLTSLRKQWKMELSEKFNLQFIVLDAKDKKDHETKEWLDLWREDLIDEFFDNDGVLPEQQIDTDVNGRCHDDS
ncbi:MAG: hypothetical protein KJ804_05905 [Proteobacteria bacterium]|nr:hypothetical protein [Pseudomonadota bacterium]